MLRGGLIAILLTAGEAHDYPVAKRLIRRVKPPKHTLGDMAYDGDGLREELDQRGTKPVIPNHPNRKRLLGWARRRSSKRWVRGRPASPRGVPPAQPFSHEESAGSAILMPHRAAVRGTARH